MSSRAGPGGTIVFGVGDRRYGTWGGAGIFEENGAALPTVATPKPHLPRDVDQKISTLKIAVKASEKAVKDAERQLASDRAELAALLAKYGLPPG